MRSKLSWLGFVVVLALAAGCEQAGVVGLSPDGKRYATMWTAGQSPVLAIGSTRAKDLRMVSDAKVTGRPVWSPDGAWIAVPTEEGVRLWDVNAARFRRHLGETTQGPVAWRPEGDQLAYFDRNDERLRVCVLNVVDREEASTTELGDGQPVQIAWASRTNAVAVLTKRDIWLVERGESERITRTSDVVGMGVSATGRTVYWAREGKNMGYILMSLYGFDLETRSVRKLAFPERLDAMNPRPRVGPKSLRVIFSPGAQRLLLIGEGLDADGETSQALVVRWDGAQPKSLARGKASFDADWSADGATLALFASEKTRLRLSAFDADGANGRELATYSVP